MFTGTYVVCISDLFRVFSASECVNIVHVFVEVVKLNGTDGF